MCWYSHSKSVQLWNTLSCLFVCLFFSSSPGHNGYPSGGRRCKVRKRWQSNCNRWYEVLGNLFKPPPCTPWLYSCSIPDELLPSYDGLWLGLPKLMTQWICQNSAHNGHLWTCEYLMFHSQILHIYPNSEAHRELFIWIVYSTMLWMAWLAPGTACLYCDSLLEFYPPQIPIIPEDGPDCIAQAARRLELQLGLHRASSLKVAAFHVTQ